MYGYILLTILIVINVCGYLRVTYPRLVYMYILIIVNVFGYLRVRHPRSVGGLMGRSPMFPYLRIVYYDVMFTVT